MSDIFWSNNTDKHTFVSDEPIDLGARWIHHYRPENPLFPHHTPSDKDHIEYTTFESPTTAFFDMDGTPLPDSLLAEAEKLVEEFRANIKQYSPDKEDISMFDVIRDKYENIQDQQMRRLVNLKLSYIEHYEASNLLTFQQNLI
jgi:hypothetical protein